VACGPAQDGGAGRCPGEAVAPVAGERYTVKPDEQLAKSDGHHPQGWWPSLLTFCAAHSPDAPPRRKVRTAYCQRLHSHPTVTSETPFTPISQSRLVTPVTSTELPAKLVYDGAVAGRLDDQSAARKIACCHHHADPPAWPRVPGAKADCRTCPQLPLRTACRCIDSIRIIAHPARQAVRLPTRSFEE
jgi:hypothetical protein